MKALPGRLERLPPGREEFSAAIAADDRARILTAMSELVSRRGYRDTSLELIQKRADVSRATFRRYFGSREECFLACFADGVEGARTRIEAAARGEAEWPEQVRAGLAALLAYVVAEPAFARVCLLEPLSIGPAGTKAYLAVLQAAAPAFLPGRQYVEDPSRLPRSLEGSIVGALVGMIRRRLERSEAEQIPGLLPTMLQFSLAPYLGAAGAGAIVAASQA